jgi:hypothetical protein
MEAVSEVDQVVTEFEVLQEAAGQARKAVIRAADRAGHGCHGIGIMARVHRREQGGLEVRRGRQEAPEGDNDSRT